MSEGKGMRGRFPRQVESGSPGVTILVNRFREEEQIVLQQAPHSHAAEEFRKVAVLLRREGSPLGEARSGCLMIVSPLEGEGKTLTAMNVALALGEETARRTLLVDFDLRRPQLETHLVETGRPGLADLLRGEVNLGEALQNCPREGIHVLTAGTRPDNATRLLNGERIERLLQALRQGFNIVVGDCPPVLPFAETRLLAGLSDAVLMVARAEATPRAALVEAVGLIDGGKLAGVVLNAIPDNRWLRYGYGYGYAYEWRVKDPE